MARLGTGTVRLAAAAVGGIDAAGPEIAGRGQPVVELRPMQFQLGKGRLGQRTLLWKSSHFQSTPACCAFSDHLHSCRTPLLVPGEEPFGGPLGLILGVP